MRIIAGQFKGRTILPPQGMTTRPITDRVKANLFNILQREIPDSFVLDLFCGTGSIGIEALSRGARRCCFADRDKSALDRLIQNIRTLKIEDCCTVWRGDILKQLPTWLQDLTNPIDIAFVDPPYATAQRWDWQQAEEALFLPLQRRLVPDGLILLRGPRDLKTPEMLAGLKLSDRRDYGGMSLIFYRAG